jgi:hypothetical protein
VARHRVLVISAIIVAHASAPELVSKTSAAAVDAVALQQDLPIYLTGLSAVQASFAEGERDVVNGNYKLTKTTVTLLTPAVTRRAS